jgi:hypothetical protein
MQGKKDQVTAASVGAEMRPKIDQLVADLSALYDLLRYRETQIEKRFNISMECYQVGRALHDLQSAREALDHV